MEIFFATFVITQSILSKKPTLFSQRLHFNLEVDTLTNLEGGHFVLLFEYAENMKYAEVYSI